MFEFLASLNRFFTNSFVRMAVVTVLIWAWDPFGLSQAAGRMSQGTINLVVSPFYARTGQDHVSAVIITDSAAERLGGYPLSFSHHARALRSILCLDPAAVFIDLDFRTARDDPAGVQAFAEALTYRAGPDGCGPVAPDQAAKLPTAPVYLAYVQRPGATCQSIRDASKLECSHMAPLAALSDVTKLINVTDIVKHQQTYALLRPDTDGTYSSSPALELAAALCRRRTIANEICDADRSQFKNDLFVRWGYYLSPLSVTTRNLSGCDATPSDQATDTIRSAKSATLLGANLISSVRGPRRDETVSARPSQPCPYSDYTGVGAFFEPDVNSNEVLRKLIAQRAVIYGANITALPDLIDSPVHGAVAGLLVHAMVVDNLLAQGLNYWREAPPMFEFSDLTFSDLFEIGIILGGLWFVGCGRTFSNRLARAALVAVGCLIVGILSALWLNSAPLNWLFAACVQFLGAIADGRESKTALSDAREGPASPLDLH